MEYSGKELFASELGLIKSPIVKEITEKVLAEVPSCFFEVPASSTGKYHPQYALGLGGLYRHVRAAVRIASHLLSLEQVTFTQDEKDMIIASLILHDCWKQGNDASGSTIHEHPIVAADKIRDINLFMPDEYDEYVEKIANNVASHMGQWTTNRFSVVVLPKPVTEMEKFVHACDYMASRKDIEVLNV